MSERILADGLHFPEGPAFDRRGNLWCVELQGGGLVCWKDGTWSRIPTGGAPNGIAIDWQDRVIFCDSEQLAIRRYEPNTGVLETLADRIAGEPLFKPNDLAFDASGNLLFTCPGDSRTEPTGYVCVLRSDGEMHKIGTGFYFCNGLALTPEGTELIVAETYCQRLWRGKWDASSTTWINPRIWCEGLVGAPGPDGMAWADDGSLWVAVYGSGMVFQIGQNGDILSRVKVAGKNPTNCAIDPSGSLGLVVTEAATGRLLSYSIPHKPAIF
jgi:gluconolactonase